MAQVLKKEAGLDGERPKGLEQRRGIRVWAESISGRGGVCFSSKSPAFSKVKKGARGRSLKQIREWRCVAMGRGLVERGGARRHICREVLLRTGQTSA